MNAEPQLEELSAYLDHELTGSARQDLESHLAACETCRRRLDALKETVHAVRGLPLETPARTFTIPAQRRQAPRWEPAAWVGGLAAAAVLVVIVGINLPHGGSGLPTLSSKTQQFQNPGAAGAGAGTAALSDRAPGVPFAAFADRVTVSDPRDPVRQVTLSTDAASYRADGTLTVHVSVQGWTFATTPQATSQAGISLYLIRGSSGAELTPYPRQTGSSGTAVSFSGSYPLNTLALAQPVAGAYRLLAIWTIPDGRGATVQAELPVQITG